jgi:hypothetical protein
MQLIAEVKPIYPQGARDRKIGGNVGWQVVLAADGSAKKRRSLVGDRLLAESARITVLQRKYRSTLFNGKPVEVETTVRRPLSARQRQN